MCTTYTPFIFTERSPTPTPSYCACTNEPSHRAIHRDSSVVTIIQPRAVIQPNPHTQCMTDMGVDHGARGDKSPRILSGGLSPQILSCCEILSTRLLALQCRKMCFCLYNRTFIVSPAMRPPQNSSQIYAYDDRCCRRFHFVCIRSLEIIKE